MLLGCLALLVLDTTGREQVCNSKSILIFGNSQFAIRTSKLPSGQAYALIACASATSGFPPSTFIAVAPSADRKAWSSLSPQSEL
ncbi:hypothetical protein MFRU_004g03320 [Monilinia fructicola]|nr:hypothetical protein MFRU_004g03320 [Monilinia fructicola]